MGSIINNFSGKDIINASSTYSYVFIRWKRRREAAVVITGGNVNGHTAWKYEGRSLADIEVEESLESDSEN